jgi:hypothetical protein
MAWFRGPQIARHNRPYSCAHDAFAEAILAGCLPRRIYPQIVAGAPDNLTHEELLGFCEKLGLACHVNCVFYVPDVLGRPGIEIFDHPDGGRHASFNQAIGVLKPGMRSLILFHRVHCKPTPGFLWHQFSW